MTEFAKFMIFQKKQSRCQEMYKRSTVTEGKVHTGFWWEDMGETDHFENLGTDGKIIIKWFFKKCEWGGTD